MVTQANAKLNLTLDVLSKRMDGYHDMRMIMQSIDLMDNLSLEKSAGQGLRVKTNLHFLPNNEKNLAAQAALQYWAARGEKPHDLTITIEKNIPVCAGMAGGSSDAAAVLRALNKMDGYPFALHELAQVGEKVGSDVPYCVMGNTALAEGRGEVLTTLPALPKCWVVVCKPDFSISTPALFACIDSIRLRRHPDTKGAIAALEAGDLIGVARRMYNVFEEALPQRQVARIYDLKNVLIQHGALGASMSGTGPTVFGLFEDRSRAQGAYEQIKECCKETFLSQTV